MPTNRRHKTREKLISSRLTPEVRLILSSGMDFFDELSRMRPVQLDRWGKIQRNLWVFVEACHEPGPYDPPSWLLDARLDFLRSEWAKHKTEVLRWHIDRFRDGSRPFGWWAFGDAPEKYPPFAPASGRSEDHFAAREKQRLQAIAVLVRHNLLSEEEQHLIRAADAAAALRAPTPGESEGRNESARAEAAAFFLRGREVRRPGKVEAHDSAGGWPAGAGGRRPAPMAVHELRRDFFTFEFRESSFK